MAKLVIIDDLDTEIELMKMALAPGGYDIHTAADAETGIDLVKKESPDAILLDVVLPGMDGFAACRKLKKEDSTKNIPVILISSKSEESDKFWGLKQGASDYVFKPFDGDALLNTVKQYAN
ncbi:MAG: response regulator [Verrucomicrobiota bacterium]